MLALDPDTIEGPEVLRDRYAKRTRTICNDCGAKAALPGTVIAAFPRPWRRHVDGRVLCTDCWSSAVAAETALTAAQAEVLALEALGFAPPAIAASLGVDQETARAHRNGIKNLECGLDEFVKQLINSR